MEERKVLTGGPNVRPQETRLIRCIYIHHYYNVAISKNSPLELAKNILDYIEAHSPYNLLFNQVIGKSLFDIKNLYKAIKPLLRI
ncbi:hypothetical protein EF513_06620 [Rickettsiales endosymbiont of Stachyamoeba lipophora]|nr:hypothetical protein EF513_06620 [Rickettsiales endosymbiont of Stachyamoeba lipophora]